MHDNKGFIGLIIVIAIGLALAGGIVINDLQKTSEPLVERQELPLGAPISNVTRSLIPQTDNTYYLGTTTPQTFWANVYTQGLTVADGSSTTTISAGDTLSTFAFPWTPETAGNATGTTLIFEQGFISDASSTITSTLVVSGLTTLNGGLGLEDGDTFTFSGDSFTDFTGDATISLSSGALQVVDLNCTDCIGTTEISDSYILNSTADSTSGLLTLSAGFLSASSTALDTLTIVNSVYASSTLTVDGLTLLTGGLTLEDGDTFTISGDAITDFTGDSTISLVSNALRVVDLVCTDCIGETEISDVYLVNNAADTTSGLLTMGAGFGSQSSSTVVGVFKVTDSILASSTLVVDGLTLLNGGLTIEDGDTFTFSGDAFTDFVGDATISLASGALRVVDLNCTDCIGATEISDVYLVNNANDTTSGVLTTSGLLSQGSSTVVGTLTVTSSMLASSTLVVDGLTTLTGDLTIQDGDTFTFSSEAFTDFTGDATISLSSGALRVVDVNCTDCLNATEIEDIYLLDDGDIGTGVYDFGGTTSFEITNGTAPTTDATGEIAVDTSQGQLEFYDGVASRIISATSSKGFVLIDPNSSDKESIRLWKVPFDLTITFLHCIIDPDDTGESADIDFFESDATGDSTTTIDGLFVCDNDGTESDGSFTNATLDENDWFGAYIDATTTTPTNLSATIHYFIDSK